MSAPAIIMLVIAIALLWGSLALALVHMAKHPENTGSAPDTVENPVIPVN